MNQEIKINHLFGKGKKPFAEFEDVIYTIHSGEKACIFPGERKLLKTFLEIEVPEGYLCQITSTKESYHKNGLYVFPEIITPSKKQEIIITIMNMNMPKNPFMMSDNERFLGEKGKVDIYVGDRIATMFLFKMVKFNII